MLWLKESNKRDALYVDILNKKTYPLDRFRMKRKKNNVISVCSRIEGNSKLCKSDYGGAMISYNQSVSFAEDNEHLCLAYANRSLCFLKLNKFDRCLIDIRHARHHNYPNHLSPKLVQREELCLKALKSVIKPIKSGPQLSFQCNEKLPSLASLLEIQKDVLYGRMIKAKEDIPINQTILVEKAYVRAVSGIESRCEVCGKQQINFIPCASCADTLYCSEECANNNFHAYECDLIFGHQNLCDSSSLSFILRSVIVGISTFSTVDYMEKFIENCLSTDPQEICESTETYETKYRTFFKLSAFVDEQGVLDFRKKAFYIFNAIMSSNDLAVKFETISRQRFLIHLIIHHGLVLKTNSFGGSCGEEDTGGDSDYEQNIFLLTSFMNHSCIPNAIKLSKNNLAVVKTIQPIKQGQQIFLSYISEPSEMTGIDRNNRLKEVYGFRCKCELCLHGFKVAEPNLEDDKSFMYVAENVNDCDHLLSEIKEHCISFIVKYLHMLASEECLFILGTLGAILQKEIELF